MVHVRTSADFLEHYAPLPDSMGHLLPDKGNKWIPGTLVEAGAAPSEPIRKLTFMCSLSKPRQVKIYSGHQLFFTCSLSLFNVISSKSNFRGKMVDPASKISARTYSYIYSQQSLCIRNHNADEVQSVSRSTAMTRTKEVISCALH
jgi:hypothetical protein